MDWLWTCWGAFRICTYRLCCKCFRKEEPPRPQYAVLALGLDGAGKSTLMAAACGEETASIQPTTGFAIKSLSFPKAVLQVREIGGSPAQRKYWDRYFNGVSALIYVIDSSARREDGGITEAIAGLAAAMASTQLADVPVLVVANKQDCPGAMSVEELKHMVEDKVHREVLVVPCVAIDAQQARAAVGAFVNEYFLPPATQ